MGGKAAEMRYNNRTDVTEKKKKLRCILGHPSLQCFILSLSRTSSFPRTSLGMDVTLHKLAFFKIHIRPGPPREARQPRLGPWLDIEK